MDEASALALNIRALRAARGLTQAQLASLAGIPRSTVSTLEQGAGNPTLQVLLALGEALGLRIEELLSLPKRRVEHFAAAQVGLTRRGPGKRARVQKLLPHDLPGVEIDRFTLEVGARLPGIPHRRGTYEYLYCEAGQMNVHIEGEHYPMSTGDVLAFAGDQRHSYHQHGRRTATAFSVVLFRP